MKYSDLILKISLALATTSLLLCACDDGPNQRSLSFNCQPNELACSTDGLSLLTCIDNEWDSQTCDTGACVILNGKAQCLPNVTPSKPDKPETKVKSISKIECDSYGDILISYSDDSKETKSCLEETGVDSKCRSYNNDLVGCEMPSSCDDAVFTEQGTCLGQRLAYCDNTYTTPMPVLWNCTSIGRVCTNYLNKASCYDTCDSSEPEFSCSTSSSGASLVNHCVDVDDMKIKDQRSAVCAANELISCDGDNIIKTTCDPDSVCVASKAVCAKVCSQNDVDKLQCDKNGKMSQCQRVDDGDTVYYVWISVGARECSGNTLNICSGSEITQTNCEEKEFTNSSGEVLATHGKCAKDYQYYEDFDMCVPAYDGQDCGDLTEAGRCLGSTLQYCYVDDNIIAQSDCSKSSDGLTACSVYAGYADCRQPCDNIGDAKCSLVDYGDGMIESYLSLCVQDEASASQKTYLITTAGCIDDTLYSCNGESVVKTNCAEDGGVCSGTACIYPLCSIASSEDCVNGSTCTSDNDGFVKGLTTCSE